MPSRDREPEATEARARTQSPERGSARPRVKLLLRRQRGEDLIGVSRELRLLPPDPDKLRRLFVGASQRGLKRRSRDRARRRVAPRPRKARQDDCAHGGCGRASGKNGVRGRNAEPVETKSRVRTTTGRIYEFTLISETGQVPRSKVPATRYPDLREPFPPPKRLTARPGPPDAMTLVRTEPRRRAHHDEGPERTVGHG